jgi:hypothetical protein
VTSPNEQSPPSTDSLDAQPIASVDAGGSQLTVYRTNRGTLLVQGLTVTGTDVGLDVPDGERLVRIPAALLHAAAAAIEKDGAAQ